MKKNTLSFKEIALVVLTSIAVTGMTSANLIAQYIRRPPDRVFVGMSHYFEDFYYYLDQFYQGAHGGWLTVNNFTTEKLAPTLIYYPHILMGKLGALFGLEPFASYNISVLVFKFIFIILGYLVLLRVFPKNPSYRFAAFLIFLFSTAFTFSTFGDQGEILTLPRRIWGTKNLITTRFGNIPYRHFINILFLSILLLIGPVISNLINYFHDEKKNEQRKDFIIKKILIPLIPVVILLLLLTIADSVMGFVLVAASAIVMILNRPEKNVREYYIFSLSFLAVILIPFILAGIYLLRTIDLDPVYRQAVAWDIDEFFKQIVDVKLADYPLSFGTLGFSLVLGLPLFLRKKKNIYEQFAGVTLAICILGYLFPLVTQIRFPGSRFIFSATYLFAGVVGFYGLLTIDRLAKKRILPILIIIYLLINFNTFKISFMQSIAPVKEPDYHFTYLTAGFYKGLLFLRNLPPKDAIVLANSYTSVDLMIPGLTGKKTYSGHFLITLNSEEKDRNSQDFFYERGDSRKSYEFLKNNNIKYVFYTSYSGDLSGFKRDYQFLKPVFENEDTSIFSY